MLISFRLGVLGACWLFNINCDFGKFAKFRTEHSVNNNVVATVIIVYLQIWSYHVSSRMLYT